MNTPIHRRDCLKLALTGVATSVVGPTLTNEVTANTILAPRLGKAEHCIFFWLGGGMAQIDTFDPKRLGDADLEKHYPGARGYEVAGFFFWQGEKDAGDPGLAARYEENLVRFIKQLRKEFNVPNAKFVLATMGESVKGSTVRLGAQVLEGHLAVDGATGKYPEFKGNVATIYTNPMAQGGSGNGHYGGKAEVYMDVGEAMGQAMVELLNEHK